MRRRRTTECLIGNVKAKKQRQRRNGGIKYRSERQRETAETEKGQQRQGMENATAWQPEQETVARKDFTILATGTLGGFC